QGRNLAGRPDLLSAPVTAVVVVTAGVVQDRRQRDRERQGGQDLVDDRQAQRQGGEHRRDRRRRVRRGGRAGRRGRHRDRRRRLLGRCGRDREAGQGRDQQPAGGRPWRRVGVAGGAEQAAGGHARRG